MQATSSGNMKMTSDLVYEPYFTLIKDPYLMCLCNENKKKTPRLIIIHWTLITLQPFQCLEYYSTLCKAMHRLKCKLHDSTNGMLKTFLHCLLIDVHAYMIKHLRFIKKSFSLFANLNLKNHKFYNNSHLSFSDIYI